VIAIRFVLCGFVTGVVWHMLSAHALYFLAPDFAASLRSVAPHPPRGGAFFFAIDLMMGIWAVWLYSAIAPRYGARATAAAVVGLAWWALKTLQSAKWAGLGFVEPGAGLVVVAVTPLLATLTASWVGAWLYDRVSGPQPRPGAP